MNKLLQHLSKAWKNIVIVILLLSAAYNVTVLYSAAIPGKNKISETDESSDNQINEGIMRRLSVPAQITVCGDDGKLCGIIYDSSALNLGCERFSALFAEAIGSADTPEPMNADAFNTALYSCGVMFYYREPVPFSVLSFAFGTEAHNGLEGYSAEMLLIYREEGSVYLAFSDSGGIYRCGTGVIEKAVEGLCSSYEDNGCYYAFTNELLSGVPAYTLINEKLFFQKDAVSSGAVSTEQELSTLYTALKISDKTGSDFTESDGTRVLVSGNATLRINGSNIIYRKNTYSREMVSASEAVEMALSCVARMLSGSTTVADVILSSLTPNPDDKTWTVCLDYQIEGSPVIIQGEDHAFQITAGDEGVSYVAASLRAYSFTGDTVKVLPMLQAEAAAGVTGKGAVLSYYDDTSNMTLGWMSGDYS